MPHCVNDENAGPYVLLKGRWLCSTCFENAKTALTKALLAKEIREHRILPEDESVGMNAPNISVDEFRRVSRIRGTHLTITRGELERICQTKQGCIRAVPIQVATDQTLASS